MLCPDCSVHVEGSHLTWGNQFSLIHPQWIGVSDAARELGLSRYGSRELQKERDADISERVSVSLEQIPIHVHSYEQIPIGRKYTSDKLEGCSERAESASCGQTVPQAPALQYEGVEWL